VILPERKKRLENGERWRESQRKWRNEEIGNEKRTIIKYEFVAI
jgi:hypothetical protein